MIRSLAALALVAASLVGCSPSKPADKAVAPASKGVAGDRAGLDRAVRDGR